MTMATNGFYLYGASWTPANGLYVWDGPYGSYGAFTNVNGLTIIPTAIYPIIYAISGGTTAYQCLSGFPYNWGADVYAGPPVGLPIYSVTPMLTNVTTRIVTILGAQPNSSALPALTVNGTVNSSGYMQNGLPLQNVFQFAAFAGLWVTNCSGLATNFQGGYANTWTGFYTNSNNGILLIPAGYSGTSIDGTNFSTTTSLICSNLTDLLTGYASYANATNVLGYYGLQPGFDRLPTNAPLVTIWAPPSQGTIYPSNTWNLATITNGMPNFSFWQGNSNGQALVSLFLSNGVVRIKQQAP